MTQAIAILGKSWIWDLVSGDRKKTICVRIIGTDGQSAGKKKGAKRPPGQRFLKNNESKQL
ncbi:hypothetical protein R50073_06470 [Maricurvus nonylphenolicus]